MNSKICELLDIEFPLVAFTHCRDVVVAVSKAGGCGVLGAVGMTPEQLEEELKYSNGFLMSVQKKLSNERFVSNAEVPVPVALHWGSQNTPRAKSGQTSGRNGSPTG